MIMTRSTPILLPLLLLVSPFVPLNVQSEPFSPPYVAYRTDPYSIPPTRGWDGGARSLYGDRIANVTLGARPSANNNRRGGARGRAKVRPLEVSPGIAKSGANGGLVGGDGDPRCPLSFRLGLTHRSGSGSGGGANAGKASGFASGINGPVVTYPAHPAHGPGRQVIFVENWERLNMLTPATVVPSRGGKVEEDQSSASASTGGGVTEEEAMVVDEQFPLLFEGANFYHSTPLLRDSDGDGILDVTVIDYDGGIYTVGLDYHEQSVDDSDGSVRKERYVKTAQVPRLYMRRDWVATATNLTWMDGYINPSAVATDGEDKDGAVSNHYDNHNSYQPDNPPFHSYFEYGLEWKEEHDSQRIGVSGGLVSADVLSQSVDEVQRIDDRRSKRWQEAQDDILERAKKKEEQNKAEEDAGKEAEASDAAQTEAVPELVDDGGDAVRGDRRRRLQEVAPEAGGDNGKETANAANATDTNTAKDNATNTAAADTLDAAGASDNTATNGSNSTTTNATETMAADKPEAQNDGQESEPEIEVINAIPVDKAEKGQKDEKEEPVVLDKKVDGQPCGDCYGAGEEDECCNTCAQVVAAYKKKNWGYKKADISQCVDENDLKDDDTPSFNRNYGDDDEVGAGYRGDDDEYRHHDDEYPAAKYTGDDYYPHYDDYYDSGRNYNSFYSDENYIRVTPHVLGQPAYVQIPKRYRGSDEPEWTSEQYLIIPVSYYMDEDEFKGLQSYRRFKNKEGGDETETMRGQYVASAILFYNEEYNNWSTQTHLDVSTDWTAPLNTTIGDAPIHENTYNGYGAFALASPTVASFDSDWSDVATSYVVMGTSMGLLYVLEVPGATRKEGFPVRFPYPIIRRAVVEDVVGDVTPEIIAIDEGGNIACLDGQGQTVWHRDVVEGERNIWRVAATSEITLGDVDGDGKLDVVVVARLIAAEGDGGNKRKRDEIRMYALDASNGDDLARYPMSIDVPTSRIPNDRSNVNDSELPLPQPLLVDLHDDQKYWLERIQRNWTEDSKAIREQDAADARRMNNVAANAPLPDKKTKIPHGGRGRGLHIVQPIKDILYIIEGGTGCVQTINIGDDIAGMVQADDVHGTGALDLIITTASGQVLTLEASGAVPFHPLNTWNSGPVRSRVNGHAQGYSASSGIFVHERSRKYKNWNGIYVVVTFDIFDRRPNAGQETAEKRKYLVDIRHGTSSKRLIFHKIYDTTGTFTERIFIPFGPGYYSLTARLTTTHGLIYEDTFSLAYNVGFVTGLAWIILVPLIVAAIPLLSFRRQVNWEEDDDFSSGGSGRILG